MGITEPAPQRRLVRVAWFVGLWVASVAVLWLVAMALRAVIGSRG